jgi:hypothetical protein
MQTNCHGHMHSPTWAPSWCNPPSCRYNAFPHAASGGWVINYNFFYGWNGCLNMVFSSRVHRAASQDASLEYYFCPSGLHEGDWERLSLLLCPGEDKVQAALFSQHDFDALFNSSDLTFESLPGEVRRYKQQKQQQQQQQKLHEAAHPHHSPLRPPPPLRPPSTLKTLLKTHAHAQDPAKPSHVAVYSALHSHATYPTTEPSTVVYAQVRTFHGDTDGIFVVDRVARSEQHRWLPSQEGLVLLPQLADPPSPPGTAGTWAHYPGWW